MCFVLSMKRSRSFLSFNSFARSIALPSKDLIERTSISTKLSYLERSQWWSKDDLLTFQTQRLRQLIHHAYDNVPYYHDLFRSLGLLPADISTVDDLKKIPVLTKNEVRSSPERFLATGVNTSVLIRETTSGSSGKVFTYFIDRNALSISRSSDLRAWGFSGYRVGDRITTLAGSSLLSKNMSLYMRLRFAFSRNLPLSSYNLDQDRLQNYLNLIRKFKPMFIRGYPSSVAILAEYIQQTGQDSIPLQGVMTTAETLSPRQRKIITEVFNCPVFDQFGCNDGGAHACECDRHEGYHIAMERSVHEFLDDGSEPVSPGENGHIILTDLWNYAMPLIRYDAGDMAIPTERTCSCGRGLPMIAQVTGRTIEQIAVNGGRVIPALPMTDIFDQGRLATHIIDYQVIQEGIERFVVNIVMDKRDTPSLQHDVTTFFSCHLGYEVEVIINIVETLPRTEADKRKIFLCNVKKS